VGFCDWFFVVYILDWLLWDSGVGVIVCTFWWWNLLEIGDESEGFNI